MKKGKKKAKKEEPALIPIEKVVVTPELLTDLLGPARFRDLDMDKKNEIGATTGLAWTEVAAPFSPPKPP